MFVIEDKLKIEMNVAHRNFFRWRKCLGAKFSISGTETIEVAEMKNQSAKRFNVLKI